LNLALPILLNNSASLKEDEKLVTKPDDQVDERPIIESVITDPSFGLTISFDFGLPTQLNDSTSLREEEKTVANPDN